jgi:hypothetical protein
VAVVDDGGRLGGVLREQRRVHPGLGVPEHVVVVAAGGEADRADAPVDVRPRAGQQVEHRGAHLPLQRRLPGDDDVRRPQVVPGGRALGEDAGRGGRAGGGLRGGGRRVAGVERRREADDLGDLVRPAGLDAEGRRPGHRHRVPPSLRPHAGAGREPQPRLLGDDRAGAGGTHHDPRRRRVAGHRDRAQRARRQRAAGADDVADLQHPGPARRHAQPDDPEPRPGAVEDDVVADVGRAAGDRPGRGGRDGAAAQVERLAVGGGTRRDRGGERAPGDDDVELRPTGEVDRALRLGAAADRVGDGGVDPGDVRLGGDRPGGEARPAGRHPGADVAVAEVGRGGRRGGGVRRREHPAGIGGGCGRRRHGRAERRREGRVGRGPERGGDDGDGREDGGGARDAAGVDEHHDEPSRGPTRPPTPLRQAG